MIVVALVENAAKTLLCISNICFIIFYVFMSKLKFHDCNTIKLHCPANGGPTHFSSIRIILFICVVHVLAFSRGCFLATIPGSLLLLSFSHPIFITLFQSPFSWRIFLLVSFLLSHSICFSLCTLFGTM